MEPHDPLYADLNPATWSTVASGEELDAAITSVGDGASDGHAARRVYLIKQATSLGLSAKIPANWGTDGTITETTPRSALLDVITLGARPCERTFEVEDMSIRSDGEGRTVVAYAAIFDTPAEIHDQDGHYMETVSRSAFDKTIQGRLNQIGVFYNHGKTLYGTPSERFSMPLGSPVEIRPDSRGLLTATRYNKNPLADEVLEGVRNGDIRGQSFSGRFLPGRSQRTRGTGGSLDIIVRSEIALREYGPTPSPAYEGAAIVGVRSEEWDALAPALAILAGEDIDAFRSLYASLSEQDRSVLRKMLLSDTSRTIGTPSSAADAAHPGTSAVTDPPGAAHRSCHNSQYKRRLRVLDL